MLSITKLSSSNLVSAILNKYRLEYVSIGEVQKGYRNQSYPVFLDNHQVINLIVYKCEPGIEKKIENSNRISGYLSQNGFPTRYLVDQRMLRIKQGKKVQFCCLYNYLDGQTIPWEAYTQKHLRLIGMFMSNMHRALINQPKKQLPAVADLCLDDLVKMEHYFGDEGVGRALNEKLGLHINMRYFYNFRALLKVCQKLQKQQPLHMDLVRGNILYKDSPNLEISGIIDFEKTAYGHPVFDVARTMAFLLVDCKYKTTDKVIKYFLHSGYNKYGRSRLSKVSVKFGQQRTYLLALLTNFFLLHDLYKFLLHNPYEFLASNEHFVRTRDTLIGQGLITYQ